MEFGHIIPFIIVSVVIITVGYQYIMRNRKPVAVDTLGAAPAPKDKKPGYLTRVRGKMNPVTFFGILVFTAILIIFMLIPGDLVAYVGTILMWALTALILTSIVMLVTGWGSRMVWLTLLAGSVWLAYNPPATTAQRVAQGAETLMEKGLKGVAPSVTPLIPNVIYMSPEEKAAARKAEAEELKRQQELARIKAEEEAHTRVAAEVAAARELEATMTKAKAVPCLRRYEKQLNCFTVKFGYNTVYERTALKDHCIISDPVDAVQRVDVGGNQYQFFGQSGLTAQFFDVPIGKWTFEGKEVKCGV